VLCPGCGHDYFHQAHGVRLVDALADAYWAAEALSYHHLTAVGGEKVCPIREYAWIVEEERERERASTVRPRQPTRVA
jgi:hypothetical protein